jgi:hypothetical protein
MLLSHRINAKKEREPLVKVLSKSEEIIKINNIYLLTDAVICYARLITLKILLL